MKTPKFLMFSFLAFTGCMTGHSANATFCVAQAAESAAQQDKPCTVQGEEMGVFASYLREGIASPQVLVTETVPAHVDTDALNLQLLREDEGFLPTSEPTLRRKTNPAA